MFVLLKSRLFIWQFLPLFIILADLLALYAGSLMVCAPAGIMAREYVLADAYRAAVAYPKERPS